MPVLEAAPIYKPPAKEKTAEGRLTLADILPRRKVVRYHELRLKVGNRYTR